MKAQSQPPVAEARQAAAARSSSGRQAIGLTAFVDNRPAAAAQRKLADALRDSPGMVAQRLQLRGVFGDAAQFRGGPEDTRADLERVSVPRSNKTGLPDGLKSGVESLSGISLDNVKVHYGSAQPAQLNALAYAQGAEIHVAPGQERHLPHEAWHVVQQAQGKVAPTINVDGVPVNDDERLEHEADSMGAKALAGASPGAAGQLSQTMPELSSSHLAQFKDLSDKEVAQIDQKAWDAAIAATLNHRPANQKPVKIDDGEDDDQDAITRIRGKNNEILEVKYYPENPTFSRTNRSVRLGQMTALFNHELVYHGSHEVLANYNTDLEDADDEHFAMFDPARRDNLLESTVAALEQMTDVKARLTYINWWEADVKTHADWDESRQPSERLEGKKWVTKTARALRNRFASKGGKRGRNDRDVSHRGPLQRVEKVVIKHAKKGARLEFGTPGEAASYAVAEGFAEDEQLETLTELIKESEHEGEFNTRDDFQEFVEKLVAPETSESDEDAALQLCFDGEENLRKEITRLLTEAHVEKGSVASQADHYVTRMTEVLQSLENSEFGVRWRIMEDKEKQVVAERLLHAMLSIGTHVSAHGREDLGENMEERSAIAHGSFLFGSQTHAPGDMDVILDRAKEKEAVIPVPMKTRGMKGDTMTIGTKHNLVDTMAGIPVWGGEDLSQMEPAALWEQAEGPINEYIKAAREEEDQGKAYRKWVNIAICLDYILERIDPETASGLEDAIKRANGLIVSGGKKAEAFDDVPDACKKAIKEINSQLEK